MWLILVKAFSRVLMAETVRPDAVFCESAVLATRYAMLPVLLGASAALLLKMLIVALAGRWISERFPVPVELVSRWTMVGIFLLMAYRLVRFPRALPTAREPALATETITAPPVKGSEPFRQVFVFAFAALFCAEWFDPAQASLLQFISSSALGGGKILAIWAGVGGGLALICKEAVGALAGAPLRRLLSRAAVRWTIATCCVLCAAHILLESA